MALIYINTVLAKLLNLLPRNASESLVFPFTPRLAGSILDKLVLMFDNVRGRFAEKKFAFHIITNKDVARRFKGGGGNFGHLKLK